MRHRDSDPGVRKPGASAQPDPALQPGVFLHSVHLVRELFVHPWPWGSAVLGMALFWAADAFAVWAGLAAFGLRMDAAALIVGFGTGMVFTRRTGPPACPLLIS